MDGIDSSKIKKWIYDRVRSEIYDEIKELERDDIRSEIELDMLEELRIEWEQDIRYSIRREVEDELRKKFRHELYDEVYEQVYRDIHDKALEAAIKSDQSRRQQKVHREAIQEAIRMLIKDQNIINTAINQIKDEIINDTEKLKGIMNEIIINLSKEILDDF